MIDALPKLPDPAPPTTPRKPRFNRRSWAESYETPSEGAEAKIKHRQDKERLDHYDRRRAAREAYEAEDKVKEDEEAEEEAKRGARKRTTLAEGAEVAAMRKANALLRFPSKNIFHREVLKAITRAKKLLQQKKNSTHTKEDERDLEILAHFLTILLTQEDYQFLVGNMYSSARTRLKNFLKKYKSMLKVDAFRIKDDFFQLAPEETFELRF